MDLGRRKGRKTVRERLGWRKGRRERGDRASEVPKRSLNDVKRIGNRVKMIWTP